MLTTLLLCAALVASYLGARMVSHLRPETLRPAVLVLLLAVVVYTFVRKDFGGLHRPR